MKVIIIEGLDNTGKSTVINEIKEYLNGQRIKVIHCEKPVGSTYAEMAQNQNDLFIDIARSIISYKKNNIFDVVILDRAWYGEFVYGQLYREHNPFDIKMNIVSIEDSLNYYFKKDELSFILLNVNNIEFSIKHDDGLSISEADREKMLKEQKMFETIFKYSSIINKSNIIVNDGLEFKDKSIIFKDVCDTIKI